MSHPVRGAWIEIRKVIADVIAVIPSHPVRGAWIEILKKNLRIINKAKSHPVRGAWIEILPTTRGFGRIESRTPSGVRGLKSTACAADMFGISRTPSGVRGLKWHPSPHS